MDLFEELISRRNQELEEDAARSLDEFVIKQKEANARMIPEMLEIVKNKTEEIHAASQSSLDNMRKKYKAELAADVVQMQNNAEVAFDSVRTSLPNL